MPNVSYDPEEFTIEDFPHGDTLALPFDFLDEDGAAIDLTLGYTASMRFEQKDGTEVVTIDHTSGIALGDGTIDITVETAAWPNNCTIYSDFQAVTPSGNTETWIRVIVKLKKSITNPK